MPHNQVIMGHFIFRTARLVVLFLFQGKSRPSFIWTQKNLMGLYFRLEY
jgi:hypothetical protein